MIRSCDLNGWIVYVMLYLLVAQSRLHASPGNYVVQCSSGVRIGKLLYSKKGTEQHIEHRSSMA